MVSLRPPYSTEKIPNMRMGDASVYQEAGTGMGSTRAAQLFSQAKLKMSHRFEKLSEIDILTGDVFVPTRGPYAGTQFPIMQGKYSNGTLGARYYRNPAGKKGYLSSKGKTSRALNVTKYKEAGYTNARDRTVYMGPRGGVFVLSRTGRRAKPSMAGPRRQRVVRARGSPVIGSLFN
jgi:hypothetical protein